MTTATIAQLTNITTPALSDIYETEQGLASFQISGQQLLELIAANTILKGLASARPSANVAGRLYYATDTTTLSRDNGVSWDALATSGSVSDGDKGDVTVSGSGTVWTVDALPESRITNLTTDLAGKAATTHTHIESDVTSLVSDLALKAPLASPTFTGTPAAPTAAGGTNTTQVATTAFVATGFQPLDSDLTAIAALSTTAFGRALLALADAAALRTAGGLGTAAVVDTGTGAANVPTITQADLRYQPLDSDLTAIAALTTTSYGRSVLASADAAADRVLSGAAPLSATYITQTANSELSAEQALGSLASGYLKNTTTTGVLSVQATPIPQADLGSGSGGAGTKFLADDQTYKTVSGSGDNLGLTPTAVKTANYSASAGDLIPCDTSGGVFAITFPTAPADKTVIAIKLVTAGNTLTLTLGGSDVFNKSGGSASGSLSLANQGIVCQYKATGAIWYIVADDLSLSALDLRYQALDSDLTTIAGLTATTDNFIVSVASAWASRTPAQARTSLGLGALALLASVATANIDNDAVTYAKIQNVSATARILGRTTAGAGDVEELTGAQALSLIGAGQPISVNVFTSTTLTWPIPAGTTEIYMEVVGAGGGGGSARRGVAGSVRGGGGSGASGGRSWRVVRVSDLSGGTLDITIGAAGSGGAARTTNDTDGAAGGNGGTSSIIITSGASLLTAAGGGAGAAGVAGSGAGGTASASSGDAGAAGASSSASGAAGVTGTAGNYVPTSGGSGGGITTGDAVSNGGAGGGQRASGLTGGSAGTAGGNGGTGTTATGAWAGTGGGGGASSITGVGGNGGAGGNYGAGGGGGGASLNGNNSGAGGAGAQGVALIICW